MKTPANVRLFVERTCRAMREESLAFDEFAGKDTCKESPDCIPRVVLLFKHKLSGKSCAKQLDTATAHNICTSVLLSGNIGAMIASVFQGNAPRPENEPADYYEHLTHFVVISDVVVGVGPKQLKEELQNNKRTEDKAVFEKMRSNGSNAIKTLHARVYGKEGVECIYTYAIDGVSDAVWFVVDDQEQIEDKNGVLSLKIQ